MKELDQFARFCREHLRLENGRPLVVEDFQRRMLADFFAGATETVILISKKNGKSTLIAALSLYHLVTTPDAECVIVAASREQAGILFRQASGFVRRSECLKDRIKASQRELRDRGDTGRVRVLAADADIADRTICSLAIVDEFARHKTAELCGALRDGLGPRQSRLIGISTAGDDEESPLGKLRRAAYGLARVEANGASRVLNGSPYEVALKWSRWTSTEHATQTPRREEWARTRRRSSANTSAMRHPNPPNRRWTRDRKVPKWLSTPAWRSGGKGKPSIAGATTQTAGPRFAGGPAVIRLESGLVRARAVRVVVIRSTRIGVRVELPRVPCLVGTANRESGWCRDGRVREPQAPLRTSCAA